MNQPVALVASALANKPGHGGAAWVPVTWALGLRQLGFEVWLLEEIDSSVCVDSSGRPATPDDSANLAFFASVVERFSLPAALIIDGARVLYGPTWEVLEERASASRLLVNISGHLCCKRLFDVIGLRVFLDLDPGFTQFWMERGLPGARVAGHHVHYTIGENIGQPGCRIPRCGIDWKTTRNPVILGLWPPAEPPEARRFTTVATWRGAFGPLEVDGERFGARVHEFRRFTSLPRMAAGDWEIALEIDPADEPDRQSLLGQGWELAEPTQVAGDTSSFADYVRGSAAEFCVAQEMYVKTSGGWFSDRTTRYLASGRPALVQDTGFRTQLPVGEGVVAFQTLEEAVQGAEIILSDYAAHAAAARALAERWFDSDRIIGQMLQELGVTP